MPKNTNRTTPASFAKNNISKSKFSGQKSAASGSVKVDQLKNNLKINKLETLLRDKSKTHSVFDKFKGIKENKSLVPVAIKYDIQPITKRVKLKKIDYTLLNKQVDIFESFLQKAILDVKSHNLAAAEQEIFKLRSQAGEFEKAFNDLREFVAEKAQKLSSKWVVPNLGEQEKILKLVSNFEKLSLRFVKYKDVLEFCDKNGIQALEKYNHSVINVNNYLRAYLDFQNVPKMLNPRLDPEIQSQIADNMFETTRMQREALKKTKLPRFTEEMHKITPNTKHGIFRPPEGFYDAYVVELVDAISNKFGRASEERRECVIDSLLNVYNNIDLLHNHYGKTFLTNGDRIPSDLMDWATTERRLILDELTEKKNALSTFLNTEVGIRYNSDYKVWQRAGSYKIGRVNY